MLREIHKLPETPVLNDITISLLTKLCFREDDKINSFQNFDTIFMFGTSISLDKAAEIINNLMNLNPKAKLVLSGGNPTYEDSSDIFKSEAEMLYEIIKDKLSTNVEFYLETKSNNCLENVINSLPFLNNSKKIVMITKGYSSGRQYLTLRKYFPATSILQQSFEPFYPKNNFNITKNCWYMNEFSIKKVWGEFLRIRTYGKRGDIEYEEVRKQIKTLLNNLYESYTNNFTSLLKVRLV